MKLRKLFFYAAAVVTLLALALTVAGRLAKRDWLQRRAEFIASGVYAPYETLIPPLIPDEQNFAAIPLLRQQWEEVAKERPLDEPYNSLQFEALPELNLAATSGVSVHYPFDPKWVLPDLNPTLPTIRRAPAVEGESAAQAILQALEPQRALLDEIAVGLQRPGCRFPIRYERTLTAVQPSSLSFRRLAQVYGLRATARIEAGLADAAAQDVASILRLGAHFRRDPVLVKTMIGVAISNLAAQFVWQGLARQLWQERHLQSFERELAVTDLFRDYRATLRMETSMGASLWEDSLRTAGGFRRLLNVAEAISSRAANALAGDLVLYPCLTAYVRQCGRIDTWLPASRPAKIDTRAYESLIEEIEAAGQRWDGLMIALTLPGYQRSFWRVSMIQARLELCLSAIRLERARQAQGRFPATLEGLQLPNDFLTGLPVRYEVAQDGSRYRIVRQSWILAADADEKPNPKDFNHWEWYSNVGGAGAWKEG